MGQPSGSAIAPSVVFDGSPDLERGGSSTLGAVVGEGGVDGDRADVLLPDVEVGVLGLEDVGLLPSVVREDYVAEDNSLLKIRKFKTINQTSEHHL